MLLHRWTRTCFHFEFTSRSSDTTSFRVLKERSHSNSYLFFFYKSALRPLLYGQGWRDDIIYPFLFMLLSISEVLPCGGFLQEEEFCLHLNLSKGTTYHPASFAFLASLLSFFWGATLGVFMSFFFQSLQDRPPAGDFPSGRRGFTALMGTSLGGALTTF